MATLLCTGGLASTLLHLSVLRSLDDPGLVLLQDLTWRNSMRPLFVAIGLEDVADDMERWTKATPCQTAFALCSASATSGLLVDCAAWLPAGNRFGTICKHLHSAWKIGRRKLSRGVS